jgi:hypothetical protein
MWREQRMLGSMEERRQSLRLQADSRFVDCEEFRELLTSRRKLVRADDRSAGVRGLFEPATGERFFIEENRLVTGEDFRN